MNKENKDTSLLNPDYNQRFDTLDAQGIFTAEQIRRQIEEEGVLRFVPEINGDDPNKYAKLGAQMAEKVGNYAVPEVVPKPKHYIPSKRPLSWRERRRT